MGITTVVDDMVSLTLLGLITSWNSVNGREKWLDWERLWSDLMQEEIKRSTRDGSSSKNDDEKNLAEQVRQGNGRGRLPISNRILLMRWDIMRLNAHRRSPRRDPQKDWKVMH